MRVSAAGGVCIESDAPIGAADVTHRRIACKHNCSTSDVSGFLAASCFSSPAVPGSTLGLALGDCDIAGFGIPSRRLVAPSCRRAALRVCICSIRMWGRRPPMTGGDAGFLLEKKASAAAEPSRRKRDNGWFSGVGTRVPGVWTRSCHSMRRASKLSSPRRLLNPDGASFVGLESSAR